MPGQTEEDGKEPNHFQGGTLKTAAKIEVLDEYLDKYTDIINSNFDTKPWYIDTHAGTGRTALDNGVTIDSSALIALDEYRDSFGRFYFYEIDPDHFAVLKETIESRIGVHMDQYTNSEGFEVAKCEDPRIRIMQLDSNEGIEFLTKNSSDYAHWFTFVDPKGLTVKKSTIDALMERANMDILINYQSEGVMRNAQENAAGDAAVTRTLGDDEWETDGSADDYVRAFENRLNQNEEWASVLTKNMQTNRESGTMRFDLVFASQVEPADRIMKHLMNDYDLWEEASSRMGQAGLSSWA